jgi:N-acetylglucosaminyldiphosphoundecaprenol N-acetyl-beta-D-mannosaminyltransferase
MQVVAAPKRSIRTVRVVGVRVDAIDSIGMLLESLIFAIEHRRALLMTFANPATAVLAAKNDGFSRALEEFDVVAPDGMGMVLAMQMLHPALVPAQRISFDNTSLAPLVFKMAVDRGINIVLSGGASGVAEAARERLMQAYPGLHIDVAFDGYREMEKTVSEITKLAPGIVIAGMGAPNQEQFLLKLVKNGWVGLGFTCGGYLDQLALKGTQYYPWWVDRYNFRWVYRLIMEPRRLWRRYLFDYTKFGVWLFGALLRQRESRVAR